MQKKVTYIYVYILNTLSDWELGFVISALHSGQFFKKNAQRKCVKTVSFSKEAIITTGGMTIIPDYTIHEIDVKKENVLLLPGAHTWHDIKHIKIIDKAKEFLEIGGLVGAICGAAGALARAGILDNKFHTSNAKEFLEMVAPEYKGQNFYRNDLVVIDNNLITTSAAGYLLWAKYIIKYLNVFSEEVLEAWYNYYKTGDSIYFFDMLSKIE